MNNIDKHIIKPKTIKDIVNINRELVEYNGNYNPKRYKHYLNVFYKQHKRPKIWIEL